jgi:APA family basic amino acid/polyamine antiporter
MIVIGGTVGSGIFFTPAEVARATPSLSMILLIWVLGGAVAYAGAFTYAELGARHPEAGGQYLYIREAFGRLPAFLFGWMSIGAVAAGAIAAVSLAFAGYCGRLFDLSPLGGPPVFAAITIALITAINVLGLKPVVALQNGLAIAKTGTLSLLVLAGIALWLKAPNNEGANAVAALPSGVAISTKSFAAAFVPVLFTIGGWQQINMLAGEIRNPGRVLPRALLVGIGVVALCYLAANFTYVKVLGVQGVAASEAVGLDTAARLLGPVGGKIVSLGILISMFGLIHMILFSTPRVVLAMGRDRLLFAAAANVHPRFGSPHIAVLSVGAWAIVLLFAAGGKIGVLLSAVVFADWMFLGLGAASIFVLRSRRAVGESYRMPGYPVVPALFIVAAMIGVTGAVLASPPASLAGAGFGVVGALVFALFKRKAAPAGAPKGLTEK